MKITAIDLDATFKDPTEPDPEWWNTFAGCVITLEDNSKIYFGIRDGQYCCEKWNYLQSSDDASDFINAEYLGWEERDTWPEGIEDDLAQNYLKNSWNELGFQAIDIKTSNGTLQLVVYNSHNGYYSHSTIFKAGDHLDKGSL